MPEDHHPLRVLRLQRRLTLEAVAAGAGISYKCISEIERRVTRTPSYKTLCRILAVLDACAPVNREAWQAIFDLYDLRRPCPLPTAEEIDAARQGWCAGYDALHFPACLVDVSQRLLAWNRCAPRLLGMRSDDVRMRRLQNATLFDVLFDLAQRFVKIENYSEYLHRRLSAIKCGLRPYEDEPWYAPFIAQAQRRHPHFKSVWDSVSVDTRQAALAEPPIPLTVWVPGESAALTFSIARAYFGEDGRFWSVLWLPVNATAMQRCLALVEGSGSGF